MTEIEAVVQERIQLEILQKLTSDVLKAMFGTSFFWKKNEIA